MCPRSLLQACKCSIVPCISSLPHKSLLRARLPLLPLLSGSEGLFLVVDERGVFREDNFQKAVAALTDTAADGKGMGAKKGEGKKDSKQVGDKLNIMATAFTLTLPAYGFEVGMGLRLLC